MTESSTGAKPVGQSRTFESYNRRRSLARRIRRTGTPVRNYKWGRCALVGVCHHIQQLAAEYFRQINGGRDNSTGPKPPDDPSTRHCNAVFERRGGRVVDVGVSAKSDWPQPVPCDANRKRGVGCNAVALKRCPERWQHENGMLIRWLADVRRQVEKNRKSLLAR